MDFAVGLVHRLEYPARQKGYSQRLMTSQEVNVGIVTIVYAVG